MKKETNRMSVLGKKTCHRLYWSANVASGTKIPTFWDLLFFAPINDNWGTRWILSIAFISFFVLIKLGNPLGWNVLDGSNRRNHLHTFNNTQFLLIFSMWLKDKLGKHLLLKKSFNIWNSHIFRFCQVSVRRVVDTKSSSF